MQCLLQLARSVLLLTLLQVSAVSALETVLFEDDFDAFFLNTIWQAHGSGEPEISLGLSQPGVLQLHSDSIGNEFRGIENITPISLTGLSNITFDVRLRPINQGVEGTLSSAELALFGGSGDYIRAFASNNVGPEPSITNDWADYYEDSLGNASTSGPYTHCASGGCDSYRSYSITMDTFGTTIQVRNADDSLHGFAANYSNMTLSDLGTDVRIALRQKSVNGADEVVGWFDSVRVTTDTNDISGTSPLLNAPYSQFTDGPWEVKPLAGQTEFTLASYGNPTGLSTLQQFTAMLQSRGLGNGIDLGSSPRPWVQQEYQHIQSLGWSFTAWPGAADHQVDGGTGLDPAYEPILQILDTPSAQASIHFGEWGYYFHELSSNAGYFASIYSGQSPSEYAHLMKAPGSKGFDTPPVNKVDAYNQVKAYYMNRDSDWGGRIASVTGHSHYEAYAGEWGSPAIGLEIGENIRFTQSKFAFARGAARQWEVPWSVQVSPWFHGALTTAGPLTGGPGTARGQDAGHSFSFYRRSWLHSWFAGAAKLTPEFSTGNLFETTTAPWDLTPLGELAVDVAEIMDSHDRGVPYTPVAIILDHYAGYNAYQDRPWGVLSKTVGDQKTYDLFQHQLFPGSANSNNPSVANPEAPYLVATPYGEMFDVLLSTASANTLEAYPEILLVGDILFDAAFVDSLEGALQFGSKVQMQQAHVDALGATDFTRLQNAGEVTILSEWVNPATGRPSAISNAMLQQLNAQHMPVVLSGDPIQYQVNRNEEGWVVELVNNKGVVKVPHLPAVIDTNEIASVNLQPTLDVYGAYDWLSGEWLAADSSPWNLVVDAGDVRFIQLITAFESDFDLDGDVDGADLFRWQRGVGQFNGDADRASGDANGDGFVDDLDLALWKEQNGKSFEVPTFAAKAIPEPAAWWMCVIACLMYCSRRGYDLFDGSSNLCAVNFKVPENKHPSSSSV